MGITSKELDQGLKKAEKNLKNFQTNMNRVADTLQPISTGLIGLGVGAATASVQIDRSAQKVRVLAGNFAEAQIQIKRLKDTALKFNLPVEQVNNLAIKLRAVGFQFKEIPKMIETFGNISLGDPQSLDRIVLAMSQIKNSTNLQKEELNQLSEASYNYRDAMAKAFGADFLDQMKKGSITGKQAFDALFKDMSTNPLYRDALKTMADSASGSWTNMVNTIKNSLAELGDSLPLQEIFTKISTSIKAMVARWREMTPEQRKFLINIGGMLALSTPVFRFLSGFAGGLKNIVSLVRDLNKILPILNTRFNLVAAGVVTTAKTLSDHLNYNKIMGTNSGSLSREDNQKKASTLKKEIKMMEDAKKMATSGNFVGTWDSKKQAKLDAKKKELKTAEDIAFLQKQDYNYSEASLKSLQNRLNLAKQYLKTTKDSGLKKYLENEITALNSYVDLKKGGGTTPVIPDTTPPPSTEAEKKDLSALRDLRIANMKDGLAKEQAQINKFYDDQRAKLIDLQGTKNDLNENEAARKRALAEKQKEYDIKAVEEVQKKRENYVDALQQSIDAMSPGRGKDYQNALLEVERFKDTHPLLTEDEIKRWVDNFWNEFKQKTPDQLDLAQKLTGESLSNLANMIGGAFQKAYTQIENSIKSIMHGLSGIATGDPIAMVAGAFEIFGGVVTGIAALVGYAKRDEEHQKKFLQLQQQESMRADASRVKQIIESGKISAALSEIKSIQSKMPEAQKALDESQKNVDNALKIKVNTNKLTNWIRIGQHVVGGATQEEKNARITEAQTVRDNNQLYLDSLNANIDQLKSKIAEMIGGSAQELASAIAGSMGSADLSSFRDNFKGIFDKVLQTGMTNIFLNDKLKQPLENYTNELTTAFLDGILSDAEISKLNTMRDEMQKTSEVLFNEVQKFKKTVMQELISTQSITEGIASAFSATNFTDFNKQLHDNVLKTVTDALIQSYMNTAWMQNLVGDLTKSANSAISDNLLTGDEIQNLEKKIGVVLDNTKGLFGGISALFKNAINDSLVNISGAFSTLTLTDFSKNLKMTIYESIRSGMIEAFMQTEQMRIPLQKLASEMNKALSDGIISQVEMTGLRSIVDEIETPATTLYTLLDQLGLSTEKLNSQFGKLSESSVLNAPGGFAVEKYQKDATDRWTASTSYNGAIFNFSITNLSEFERIMKEIQGKSNVTSSGSYVTGNKFATG